MSKPIALQGAVVAITGGARGIGLAIAEALVNEGARVSIGDIDLTGRGHPPQFVDLAFKLGDWFFKIKVLAHGTGRLAYIPL